MSERRESGIARRRLPIIGHIGRGFAQAEIPIRILAGRVAIAKAETAFDEPALPRLQFDFVGAKCRCAQHAAAAVSDVIVSLTGLIVVLL